MVEHDSYRPISILPVLSKILERIVYKQLLSHLKNNGFLSSFQFGFRSKRSTELAVTYFTDKIRKEIDNGNIWVLFLSIYQKHFTLLVTRAFLISCRLMELTIRSFIGLLIIVFSNAISPIQRCFVRCQSHIFWSSTRKYIGSAIVYYPF